MFRRSLQAAGRGVFAELPGTAGPRLPGPTGRNALPTEQAGFCHFRPSPTNALARVARPLSPLHSTSQARIDRPVETDEHRARSASACPIRSASGVRFSMWVELRLSVALDTARKAAHKPRSRQRRPASRREIASEYSRRERFKVSVEAIFEGERPVRTVARPFVPDDFSARTCLRKARFMATKKDRAEPRIALNDNGGAEERLLSRNGNHQMIDLGRSKGPTTVVLTLKRGGLAQELAR